MPRDGSGVYSASWVNASPNTTIESAKQNALVADLVTDANAARPVTAGGTGETTARLKDGTWRFQNTADTTKLLAFDLSGLTTGETKTLTVPNASGTIALDGYATTATAAGTTTLTVASAKNQYFTGTTTQTVVLPVTSTLELGRQFRIVNNSTGLVTVQSSGANTIQIMGGTGITFAPGAPGTELVLTCVAITGTGVASWAYEYKTPTTNWVQYTPTFQNFGTVAGASIWSRRVGDALHIRGRFTSGTAIAGEARMTFGYNGTDANVTSSTTKISAIQLAGPMAISLASAISAYVLVEPNVGSLAFSYQDASSPGLTKKNADAFGSGTVLSFTAEIPIAGW